MYTYSNNKSKRKCSDEKIIEMANDVVNNKMTVIEVANKYKMCCKSTVHNYMQSALISIDFSLYEAVTKELSSHKHLGGTTKIKRAKREEVYWHEK